jgi:hypothetical protein
MFYLPKYPLGLAQSPLGELFGPDDYGYDTYVPESKPSTPKATVVTLFKPATPAVPNVAPPADPIIFTPVPQTPVVVDTYVPPPPKPPTPPPPPPKTVSVTIDPVEQAKRNVASAPFDLSKVWSAPVVKPVVSTPPPPPAAKPTPSNPALNVGPVAKAQSATPPPAPPPAPPSYTPSTPVAPSAPPPAPRPVVVSQPSPVSDVSRLLNKYSFDDYSITENSSDRSDDPNNVPLTRKQFQEFSKVDSFAHEAIATLLKMRGISGSSKDKSAIRKAIEGAYGSRVYNLLQRAMSGSATEGERYIAARELKEQLGFITRAQAAVEGIAQAQKAMSDTGTSLIDTLRRSLDRTPSPNDAYDYAARVGSEANRMFVDPLKRLGLDFAGGLTPRLSFDLVRRAAAGKASQAYEGVKDFGSSVLDSIFGTKEEQQLKPVDASFKSYVDDMAAPALKSEIGQMQHDLSVAKEPATRERLLRRISYATSEYNRKFGSVAAAPARTKLNGIPGVY